MRILIVHNEYGKWSGEEAVVYGIQRLLEDHGHEAALFVRSSAEIPSMRLGSLRAFFSGIYSPVSRRVMREKLRELRPDIVHVHNLFPFISPAVLPECRQAGTPVVMTVHNHRLVCPNGLHMTRGEVCEKCLGGQEYWCVLRNCERNPLKSLGYALRNAVARRKRYYLDNVTLYAPLTPFQPPRLIAEGFPAERITVLPNMSEPPGEIAQSDGEYVAYAGRMSSEKGVETLVAAARRCEATPFKLAGDLHRMPNLAATAPANVDAPGHLAQEALGAFYGAARMVVAPSICYETFGLSVVEAMFRGKPVICSKQGGLPYIVEDGKTGLHFEAGDAEDLAEKIRYLWSRPDLCRRMGAAGREKALREYTPEKYYERLMAAYKKAIAWGIETPPRS